MYCAVFLHGGEIFELEVSEQDEGLSWVSSEFSHADISKIEFNTESLKGGGSNE